MTGSGKRCLAVVIAAAALTLGVAAPAAANDTKIVGGAPATIQQFPWQVSLDVNDTFYGGNGFARHICGGTLVAPTIVITAAHCMFNVPLPAVGFNPANRFEVIAGRTTLSSSEGEVLELADYYYFEGSSNAPVLTARSGDLSPATGHLYNPSTSEWDAVFLKLASPVSSGVPIRIAGPDETALWAPGQPALISGWGDLFEGSHAGSDQLQAAQIPMLSDADCSNVYGAGYVATVMACAGVLAGGIDTCQGDSGGPLVVQGFQRATKAVNTVRLVGDTSYGNGCARAGVPGVYGRLAADPMRSAFRNGILQVAGVDVVGSGALAPESTAPAVSFGKHPKKRSTKKKAMFTFCANEPSTFKCALDKAAFKACSSPFKKRVKAKKHRFRVQATDIQGNVGKAVEFKWRVLR